ncbi:hypothetical protein GGR32_000152 [Mesonia hippocampi]|uniref:Uncharacterized protein n=1 Tax=Mesonia hippocampi TaxID=1628250 RepID=A0A840ELM0_9FLAO|nr:hypothetical protein [Mesonia hippocampi]
MKHDPEWDDDPYIKGSPDPNPSGAFICVVMLILFAIVAWLKCN